MALLAPAEDWSYSGDPASSDLDQVRYLVQDVDDTVRLLSDTEISYEITKWSVLVSTLEAVAAEVAERIAAKFAGVTQVNADGVSVALGDLAARYTTLAGSLRAQADRAVVSDTIDMAALGVNQRMDPSIEPLSFSIGLHDNDRAGNQQYGGQGRPGPDRDDVATYDV